MNISFGSTVYGKKADNKGSCIKLANYLEKENEGKGKDEKRDFFSHSSDSVPVESVVQNIDSNKKKLGRNDSKYFLLNISPSKKELHFIGKGKEEKFLMDYTRKLMDKYAKNFNKGLEGKDLMYYAKIEENRYNKKTGEAKPGNNYHVHVIISRRDHQQKFKLSPETNHINSKEGVIKGGFNRNNFRQASQMLFDQMTGYSRPKEDTFNFQNEERKKRVAEWLLNKQAEEKASAKTNENTNSKHDQGSDKFEPAKFIWNIIFPTVNMDSFYGFEEEEFLRQLKRRRRGPTK